MYLLLTGPREQLPNMHEIRKLLLLKITLFNQFYSHLAVANFCLQLHTESVSIWLPALLSPLKIPSTPLKCLAGVLQTELPWQHGNLAQQNIFACLFKDDNHSEHPMDTSLKQTGLKENLVCPSLLNHQPKMSSHIRKGGSQWHERLDRIRSPCKPVLKSEQIPSNEKTDALLLVAAVALSTAVPQFSLCLLQTSVTVAVTAIENTCLYSPSSHSFWHDKLLHSESKQLLQFSWISVLL